MLIREYKQRDIKTISNMDLNIILGTTFNKKIVQEIQQELIERDGFY